MKIIFFFILVCISFSCSNKYKTPPGIIRSSEMSEILWDIIRAQALANEVARKDSSINVEFQTKVFTQKVFEIHHVTSSSFDKSYDWYSGHPDILRLMFDSLYTQKQRENDQNMKEKYNHFRKDTLLRKIIRK
ncbi:MAG TPA: DUF4296 domain-containing protein [Chitinophagaceae bacterium]|nr:DUF4296 domain-containing protein [Chitinophagaceae bacterium]